MHIKEVEVHNFGPYHGDHRVSLDGGRPVTLIHGENMRGKTSFLNAIRWALYGTALDRFKRPMERTKLVNRDASESGDWKMSVKLVFDVDGVPYELTRHIQPWLNAVPRRDADFDERVYLIKDHEHKKPEEIAPEINRVLPERVSRFFLFDGELLNEYESLLADQDRQEHGIKEAIERILGVPAVENAIADLRTGLRDASKRLQDLLRQDNMANALGTSLRATESQMETEEKDLEDLKRQLDERSKEQRALQEQVQAYATIQKDVEELDRRNAEIEKLRAEEERLHADRRDALAGAWKDLLQPALEGRLRQLEAAEDALMQQFRLATELETKIKMIDDLAQRGTCPVCQQAAPNRDAERAELAGKLQQTHFDRDKLAEVSASIRKLRRVQGAGAAQTIRLIEERLAQILVDTTHAELERDKVHDRVKNHNTAAAARAYQEWEQATKEIGLLQQCIKDRTDSIRKLEAQAEDYRRKIAGLSGIAAASLNREVEIYQQLIELFRHGVDELRNQLRKAVERDASEIFRQLTTDKSYQGLRINESYGLTIVDAQGSDVQVRSAGAEQVVALSLIGALNRNAVRRGPVVMDTPFGRLDPKHRENILRFVPRMADQAVLLVHGGEVDRTRDLACIRDDINREYEIERISSRRSRFATTMG